MSIEFKNQVIKNDNVKYDYEVFVCVKEELYDMDSIINERINAGYEKVGQIDQENNVIVIISKKKD